jgi:CBS domain-containing protein
VVAERAAHRDLIDPPITDVMSSPVFSVSVGLSLGEVLEAMVRTGFRHLVVVDDVRRCLGVVG